MDKKQEKVFVKTYGCQMNDRDSVAVSMDLKNSGYVMTDKEDEADVIIFNTCSVRDQAERKALGKIQEVKRHRKNKPDLQIGVIGCMAQSRADEIVKKYDVNFVAGTDQLDKIPAMIDEAKEKKEIVVKTGLSRDILERLDVHPEGAISTQVAIMRGCNEYCTYCIVPFTRGQEKSRPVASIIAEVKELVKRGVRDVQYLGQNITAYGIIEARRERNYNVAVSPFAELLRETAKIPEIKRIRFTSPHARYFNDDLIETIANEPKIARGIHFPLQAGSDRILKLMRRRHTAGEFLTWVNKLKAKIPNVTFSTDIIVGFPGETEEEFEMTRALCNEIDFDQEFIFRYSSRKGTPAARMGGHLEEDEKMRRNQVLLADLAERLDNKNKSYIDTEQEILVEGPSKRNSEMWAGRNTNNKIVIFAPHPEAKIGDLVMIKIDRTTQHSIYGDFSHVSPNN